MTVGERIRQRRLDLDLTQEELAKRLNYKGKSAICRVEKEGNNITTDRVAKFAKALECTPAFLMGWTDVPNRVLESFTEGINEISNTIDISLKSIVEGINEDETLLIEHYRQLSEEQKDMVRRMVNYDKGIKDIKKEV